MAPNKGAQKKGGKESHAKKAEEEASSSWLGSLVYLSFFLLIVLYGGFVYDPDSFQDLSQQHQALRPLLAFFQAVDKYSPFHEFIHDSEERSKAASNADKKDSNKKTEEIVFSKALLKEYDGLTAGKGPYLAVLGQVFDVSSKADTYTPGSGYGFFSGRDGSRAFVSGQFDEEGLIDDVTGLSWQDYLGLQEWVEFYHKDYKYVGKVEGRFYDAEGKETEYKREVDGWIREAQRDKEKKDEEGKMFPGCNSEWSKTKGHRVWCTNKSGGVQRNWVGRPRKLYLPGRKERCACVRDSGPPSTDASDVSANRGDLDSPHVKEYEGCSPAASSCQLKQPEQEEEADKGNKDSKK